MPILAFLVAVMYWPDLPSAEFSPRWWTLGLGTALLLILAWQRGERIRPTPGHWLGASLMVYAALSGLWAVSPWDTAGELVHWVFLAGVFVLAAEMRDLDTVFRYAAIGCAANVLALAAQFIGMKFFNTWLFEYHNEVGAYDSALSGLFMNRDAMAEFGVVTLTWFLARWAQDEARTPVWFWVPALLCAVLPGSRSALVALLVVGIALMLAVTFRALARTPYTYLVRWRVVALSVGTYVLVLGLVAAVAVLLGAAGASTVTQRVDIWDWTMSNPRWFGWGLGSYGYIFPFVFAHNEYLHYGFELGLGSVLLWALVYYAGAWKDCDDERHSGSFVLLSLAVACTFGFPLHEPATAFLFACVSGALCGARYRDRRRQSLRRASGDEGVIGAVA